MKDALGHGSDARGGGRADDLGSKWGGTGAGQGRSTPAGRGGAGQADDLGSMWGTGGTRAAPVRGEGGDDLGSMWAAGALAQGHPKSADGGAPGGNAHMSDHPAHPASGDARNHDAPLFGSSAARGTRTGFWGPRTG
jgi:hypothetical protein